MGQVVVFAQPRTVDLEQYPDQALEANQVRLHTLYSGISAGTEITAYRGSNPYLHKQWDAERRLFVPGEAPSLRYPVSGWGYEEVGEVVERGQEVEGVSLGDLVFGVWGHRTHHIVDADYARTRILPESLDPILGIFSHIGAIALNGVHDARIRIGETVAVFGLGVLGQIVSQLAKKSGARVIGVDLLQKRLAIAQELGAVHVALEAREGEVAEKVKALTANRGADVALEVSGSTIALNEAIRCVAYSSKVVTLGFSQGEAQGLRLGEEFHHNRVNIVCSQISGVDPELTYRWNRERLARRFMDLQAEGVIHLRPLISHVISLADAAEAFRLLDKEPEQTLQVVLDMREFG